MSIAGLGALVAAVGPLSAAASAAPSSEGATVQVVRADALSGASFTAVGMVSAQPKASGPVDTDGDGISDVEEVKLGTNLNKADSDGDGISDGDEIKLGTHPNKVDTDEDGLSDRAELTLGTDPVKSDTDSDGLSDGTEVTLVGSDPLRFDTDGDGLSDGFEVLHGTNPLKASMSLKPSLSRLS
jgi:hypothetical protein